MPGNPNQVAAFFPTKRPGMFVASCDGDKLAHLIETVKEASKTTGIVTFFLWPSDKEGAKVVATLNAIVGQPRQQSSPVARRPIGGAPARPAAPAGGGLFKGGAAAAAPAPAAEPAADEEW